MSDQKTYPQDKGPVFRSVRARLGRPATVDTSPTSQANRTLVGLGPGGRGVVDVGGRTVEGRVIPAERRITLTEPPRLVDEIEEEEQPHDDPSPC